MNSIEKLKWIYDQEINVIISSFWDAGWHFGVDVKSHEFVDLEEGIDWLYEMAKEKK